MALLKLGKRSHAKDTFLQGVALVPEDKDFRQQLDKLQSEGVESTALPPVSDKRSTPAAPRTAPSQPRPTETATSAPDQDEEEEGISGVVRGYKKTSDGKTTTFFNNELDDTTKQLIGSIAPKKLEGVDPSVAIATASSTGAKTATGSVWNTAGRLF